MAVGGGVWGIDIGQCGFKALRGRLSSDGETVVAENFEYIEYPKILSQADSDPDELVREALKQFLARNSLKGDKVCISVAGQSGLARFIDLPPVEAKRLPELVGFEAKQQIPFALEDVVWDYQKMPDVLASDDEEDDDIPAENVVGLFAMKRDQVLRFIQPLVDAEVELDVVQLTPIAIYNAIAFDQFPINETEGEVDPSDWTVVISLGTDTSDLVLTNGYRVWQRSIPIGGNHFTKQLTKELKLTFAKAEHIKRNAREAADAKEVFRAMRPTFNDLVTEIQRTLGYFESLDRDANIARTIVVGNPTKLPGLTQYLEKNLGRRVQRLDAFQRLTGPQVVDEPLFRENTLSFPVSYGLVLQGLGASKLKTNLLPKEILKQRLIRSKKPWAVAIAASLLLGMAFNYFFNWRAWHTVNDEYAVSNVSWKQVQQKVNSLKTKCDGFASRDQDQELTLARLNEVGDAAVGSADGRLLWLELTKAITAALPKDEDSERIPTLKEKPLDQRTEIYIEKVESEYFPDLTVWFNEAIQEKYQQQVAVRQEMDAQRAPAPPDGDPDAAEQAPPTVADAGVPEVSGSGWVIEIDGFHFQHNDKQGEGAEYVRKFLVDQLEFGTVTLPAGENGEPTEFTMKELGILAPVEVSYKMDHKFEIADPEARPINIPLASAREEQAGFGTRRRGPRQSNEGTIAAVAYRFKVQFCWKQITSTKRLENRLLQAKEALASSDVAGGP